LINETMVPLVAKTLEVMDQNGMITLPLKVDGLEVKVTPTSPLAAAQNMEEVNSIMQFAQVAQAMGPEGQLAIKQGEMIDYIADKMGVPAAIRTTPMERQQMMQEAQQMAMAVQQAQMQGAAPEQAAQAATEEMM